MIALCSFLGQIKLDHLDGWVDGWMICHFTYMYFSTVFQSYEEDERLFAVEPCS